MEIIHRHFESLGSTNDWAKEHLSFITSKSLLLVTADEQISARGQFGRKWISPRGQNIYASFAFLSHEHYEPLNFTHILAISAARTLEDFGVTCRLKWPNDLLVGRKKIAGILCETVPLAQLAIVIGIGINVNMKLETLQTIGQPATSLFCETGKHHELQKILGGLQDNFSRDLVLFLEKGFTPFQEAFSKLVT
jgi:BirA family biotin operon repressor/biotin-[acetyl-CoA-carboxylase] ligase